MKTRFLSIVPCLMFLSVYPKHNSPERIDQKRSYDYSHLCDADAKANDLKHGTSGGHTLIVKFASSNNVIDKGGTSAGSLSTRPCIAEFLVEEDKTGTIIFTAHNEKVDLMKADTTVFLRNAKINMFKGSMRLEVDKWSHVDVTESANFTVKKDNNLSLAEYELVDAEH